MVNFYQHLGLPVFEPDPSVIRAAYDDSMRQIARSAYDPAQRRLCLVRATHAWYVLSDPDLRHRYDEALRRGYIDDRLNADLNERYNRADLDTPPPPPAPPRTSAHRRIWLPVAIAAGVAAIGAAAFFAVDKYLSDNDDAAVEVESVKPITPESPWSYYCDNSRFSFWAPQSLEGRIGEGTTQNYIVMQQAGLNDKKDEAFRTYARIIFIYTPMSDGHHTFGSTEERQLNDETRALLLSLARQESADHPITGAPRYGRMLIGDTRALSITYNRNGGEGPVCNTIYQLCNDTESVEIITSYRVADSARWASDLKDVIRTFRWTQPQ